MRQDFERRLERLEGMTGPYPERVEAWLIDGDTATSRLTGEVITRDELEARPDYPSLLRIVRVVVTAEQEGV